MEPIDYAGALRRSWRLLILLAVVGAIIAVLLPVSKAHPSKQSSEVKWESSALVGSAPGGGGIAGGVTSEQILFFAQSLALQNLAVRTAKQEIPQFKYPLYFSASLTTAHTTNQPTTSSSTLPIKRGQNTLVLLTARGKTADDAVNLANSYAGSLQYYMVAVAAAHPKSTNTKGTVTPYTGYQIQQYAESATRVGGTKSSLTSSRKVRLLAGLVIGALIGAAIVLLRELLDKHLRTAARTEANFGFPVVAEIPVGERPAGGVPLGPVPMVDVVRQPDSPGAEAFRKLRMSVMFEALAPLPVPEDPLGGAYGPLSPVAPPTGGPQQVEGTGRRAIVLVASAGSEPSRPHVAANLAAIYAEAGQQVIVISTGNVESGSPVALDGSNANEIRTEDVVSRLEPSKLANVYRLPLDSFIGNSGQLVMRAPSLLAAASRLVDLVIVETPSLLAVHHAEALSHAVDAVLIVAECRVTTFDDARKAGERMRRIEAPVLGVVLTNVNVPRNDIRQMVPRHQGEQASQATPEPALVVSGGSGEPQEPATPPQA